MFRLVVVDDHTGILEGLVGFFSKSGCVVNGFDNGLKAVEFLENEEVDVILSDVSMPSISGPEMFEQIRKSKRQVPILVYMTGQPRLDMANTYLKGARAVLPKPIDANDLLKLLRFFYEERKQFLQDQQKISSQKLEALESLRMASFGGLAGGYVHEINNALTILMSKTDLTLSRANKKSPAERDLIVEVVTPLKTLSDRIYDTVVGLRVLFLKTGESNFVNNDIVEIARQAVDEAEQMAKSSDIKIDVKSDATQVFLSCNRVQILEVFSNLISNALDALSSNTEGRINVDIRSLSNSVEFRVSDNGPGIPEAYRQALMKSGFSTKEGTRNSNSGLGLGLSICRKIVELHSGELFLDPDSKVTTFVCELPVGQSK